MTQNTPIEKALRAVRATIVSASEQAQRDPESVTLLAVSKRHSAEKIRVAHACGQRDFGENYLNEALEKQVELADLGACWHFIGHVQSNKTRKIAEHFAWVHTVDSLKIAQRLSAQRLEGLPPLNVCLQINIDAEDSKAGLAPDNASLLALAVEVAALPNVVLRGLMCIPAPKNSTTAERDTFSRMVALQAFLNNNGLSLDTLSMGMSDDLDSAIASGATMVRIGTAIFGLRT